MAIYIITDYSNEICPKLPDGLSDLEVTVSAVSRHPEGNIGLYIKELGNRLVYFQEKDTFALDSMYNLDGKTLTAKLSGETLVGFEL